MTVPEHRAPLVSSAAVPATPSGAGAGVPRRAAPEAVPQVWDESRDPAFFALTARLFPPAVTLAMTVLLASHDDDPALLHGS